MENIQGLAKLLLALSLVTGCTILGPEKTELDKIRKNWEKQRQQEREWETRMRPTITPEIRVTLEKKISPPDSRLNIGSEQYEFSVSEDVRYLKCRFKLYTGQEQPMKLFYFITARNLDHQYKIEQTMPKEVIFDKENKPDYTWGYEIMAVDGLQLEHIIPRPYDRLHYNRLVYNFYNSQGQELLSYQVRLDYTESRYILEKMKKTKELTLMPEDF